MTPGTSFHGCSSALIFAIDRFLSRPCTSQYVVFSRDCSVFRPRSPPSLLAACRQNDRQDAVRRFPSTANHLLLPAFAAHRTGQLAGSKRWLAVEGKRRTAS